MTQAASTSGIARWKMIYDWLRAELPRFEYGSDFYTAREICERFNVSTITAVRSLNELAHEGLIETIQGKGSIVRHIPRQVSFWVVQPPGHGEEFQPFDNFYVRRMHGFREAGRRPGVQLGVIHQSHLRTLFPRHGELCGFLLPQPVHPEVVEFLTEHGLPFILVDPYSGYDGLPYVRLCRARVGHDAARYLLGLGHRRVAWLTTGSQGSNFRERIKGYTEALGESGIAFDPQLVVGAADPADGSVTPATCEAALDLLLRLPQPPTAIVADDDPRMIYLLDSCRHRGIDVPGDLSILAHPDYSECSLTTPPLSVIDGQYERVGETAVQLLLDQVLQRVEPATQRIEIEPALIIRGSTGPAPAAGQFRGSGGIRRPKRSR